MGPATKTVTLEGRFPMHRAGYLESPTQAYETWGELDDDASNALLICHAWTGDSHAAGRAKPGHPAPGWWDEVIGPGPPPVKTSEGWLLVDGAAVSTGTFDVLANGSLSQSTFAVEVAALNQVSTFVLTIEPVPDADPGPSAVHILAGDLAGGCVARTDREGRGAFRGG